MPSDVEAPILIPGTSHSAVNLSSACWRSLTKEASRTASSAKGALKSWLLLLVIVLLDVYLNVWGHPTVASAKCVSVCLKVWLCREAENDGAVFIWVYSKHECQYILGYMKWLGVLEQKKCVFAFVSSTVCVSPRMCVCGLRVFQ